jgi:hypothetical protein
LSPARKRRIGCVTPLRASARRAEPRHKLCPALNANKPGQIVCIDRMRQPARDALKLFGSCRTYNLKNCSAPLIPAWVEFLGTRLGRVLLSSTLVDTDTRPHTPPKSMRCDGPGPVSSSLFFFLETPEPPPPLTATASELLLLHLRRRFLRFSPLMAASISVAGEPHPQL